MIYFIYNEITEGFSHLNDDTNSKLTHMINKNMFTSEESLNHKLDVYPNPTNGIINIKSNKNIDKIFIYDYFGNLIKEFKPDDKVNISEMNPGMYFIGVQSEGSFEKIKVIKE